MKTITLPFREYPAVSDPLLESQIFNAPAPFGFRGATTGAHLSRSMMFNELSDLLAAVPADASLPEYQKAVVEDNVLGKATDSGRRSSWEHLRNLYGLDPSLTLFRCMRRFASAARSDLPALALVCVFCRDAQLRHSFELIRKLQPGEVLTRARMEEHLEAGYPGRFKPSLLASLAQKVSTTWTISGHLSGKAKKVRRHPQPSAAGAAYAMLAGYLLGLRGLRLFASPFSSLVGLDEADVPVYLSMARNHGWLGYKSAGNVVELDFHGLLTTAEEGMIQHVPA